MEIENSSADIFTLSSNGTYILNSGSYNENPGILDSKTGKKIIDFKDYNGTINSLVFSKDEKTAITAGSDGTIRYWDIKTGTLLAITMADKNGDWVVLSPTGYFDKSDNFNGMYWVKGMEVLNLDQFFDDLYKPALLAQVLDKERIQTTSPETAIAKIMKSPPPIVKIISPSELALDGDFSHKIPVSKNGSIEIVVEVTDSGGGIFNPTLFHNGKPVEGKKRGLKKVEKNNNNSEFYTFRISLINGKNIFSAVAKSKTNIESKAYTASIIYKDNSLKKPNAHILIVGLNRYRNSKYNLNYGKPDAQAISSLLKAKSKTLFENINITKLFDENATRKNITKALDKIVNSAKPEDVFILYYAGHGVMIENEKGRPHFYIAPYGVTSLYKEKNVWENGISAERLTEYSKKISARKQVLIMDACQAGGFEETFAMRGAVEEKALKQLSRSSGIYLLAATQSEQFATEFASLKHGVFTYAILEGLGGEADGSPKDGKTTIRELSAFVEDKVPGLTKDHRGTEQFPSIYGRGQDFPILISQ